MRKLRLVDHLVDQRIDQFQLQRQRGVQDGDNAAERLGNDLRRRLDLRRTRVRTVGI